MTAVAARRQRNKCHARHLIQMVVFLAAAIMYGSLTFQGHSNAQQQPYEARKALSAAGYLQSSKGGGGGGVRNIVEPKITVGNSKAVTARDRLRDRLEKQRILDIKTGRNESSRPTAGNFHISTNTTEPAGPRIAYLTYSHLNGTSGLKRFEDFIFPTLDTWHENIDEPYYIILSSMWKSSFDSLVHSQASNFSKYVHRIHPIWVECDEGKTSSVECCKQEQGMLSILALGEDYDWIIYLDDDNYIRHHMMVKLLSQLSPESIMVLTSGPSARPLGIFGFLPQKSPYRCTKDPSYMYPWGQVIAYNRATLGYLKRALELNGLTKQCEEYRVYHDVGNAILHWMFMLPEMELRIADRPNLYLGQNIGSHGVGRCFRAFTCDMYDIKQYYRVWEKQNTQPEFLWRNATGFETTKTFASHGHPSTWTDMWHTMPISDCRGP